LRNFVHFHGPRYIDIRLSKSEQEEALRTHVALHHHYAAQAGWVSCVVETVEQVENTKQLIRQAYENCVSLKLHIKRQTKVMMQIAECWELEHRLIARV
ncbi:MAG: luciferase family protein, partial [Nitrososphaerales archaeon]